MWKRVPCFVSPVVIVLCRCVSYRSSDCDASECVMNVPVQRLVSTFTDPRDL